MSMFARSASRSAGYTNRKTTRRFGMGWILDMAAVASQRRQLRELDAHLLKDLGISESDAAHEAKRAPWDVPEYWRR